MYRRLALAVALSFSGSSVVLGQSDQVQAVCTDHAWSWAKNSRGQDPCAVAAGLGARCSPDGEYTVPVLPSGFYYSGPSVVQANDACLCNTVYYSMLSVCGQCQDGYAAPWDSWNPNCTVVYTKFPQTLPEGYAVPDWAFQPLLNNGTVNFAAAQNDHNPESTAPPSSTYTSGPTASSAGKKSNVGAIAGGVVGGVLGLALITLVVFLLLCRHKQRQPTTTPSVTFNAHQGHLSTIPEKPYDPNDPSTFPTAPSLTTTPLSSNFPPSVSPSPPYYQPSQPLQQHSGPMLPNQPNLAYQWPGTVTQHPQFHGAPVPQV